MTATDPVQRVRIYLSEHDSADGQPLYLVALERLRREGATGATAMRGVAGFGAGHRMRTAGMVDLGQSVPIVIEWIDRSDRIARVLPALDALLAEALITVEDIRAYRAALRSSGPFGGRSLGDVLARDVLSAAPGDPAAGALLRMLDARQPLLPVVDGGRVVGTFGPAEASRLGAPALTVLAALPPAERADLLARLPARALRDAMAHEPRTIYIETSVSQTVSVMVEWGLETLPVIDGDGRLAGLFGVEQALRAAIESRQAPQGAVRDAEAPPPVSLIMQMLVPTITAETPLAAALAQQLAAVGHFLVAVDGLRPVGVLTETETTRRLPAALRAHWLAALVSGPTALANVDMSGAPPAVALALTPPPQVTTRTPEPEAIRQLLDSRLEQLVVVDDEGRLAGVVTRRGVLRALAQESGG